MGCAEYCITDFGAAFQGMDDTSVWESAINAIYGGPIVGGKLTLPAGTSKLSRPISVPQPGRLIIEGQGAEATRIQNGSSDVFSFGVPFATTSVAFVAFRNLTIESLPPNGGNIFVIEGDTIVERSNWSHLHLIQGNPAKQIFRRFTNQLVPSGIYDCHWEHLLMRHGDVGALKSRPTEPAFLVSSPLNEFQANTLCNLRCENSWGAPFFKFTCGELRNNGCVMSEIDFRRCYGGMVHWQSAGNWVCKGLVQYEVTQFPIRGHGLYLGKAPLNPFAARHMTLVGCDRRSGVLGPKVSDVFLEPTNGETTGAEHIVLINCGEQTPSIYRVQANGMPLVWMGMDDVCSPTLVNGSRAVRIGNGEIRAPIIAQDRPATKRVPVNRHAMTNFV